ncbi:MAG: hypothetical protein NVS2B9_03560 [Myxococcales bacterium]
MRKLTLPAAILLLLAAACGKSAQVRASLTDAPIDNVTVFKVTVSEVRIHDDGDDLENDGENRNAPHKDADDDRARGKGWVVLCTGAQTFDLMKLRPTPTGTKVYAPLCDGHAVTVPTGKIDEFWLNVTQVHVEFVNGTKLDYSPVHGVGSGLKIEVEDDLNKLNQVELKIDFDAASSLIANLDGTFSVKPKLIELH